MFDIEVGDHKACDGISRRDFIRVGSLSALGASRCPGQLKANGTAEASPGGKTAPKKRYRLHTSLDGRRAKPYRHV